MLARIVEVSNNNCHLSKYRGFMRVTQSGKERSELGRVALDDMGALVANAHGLSYTNNLLVALAERGIPFVLCGANHNVVGMLWPMEGHHQQAHRYEVQIACGESMRKRLWATIVKAKLQNQAAVLKASGSSAAGLLRLAKMVKSGDSENAEAQGARQYWQTLFGSDFRRNQKGDGLNAMLNYGYTILRAATARAVVAAGLHPSIGLHHSNDNNAMRLVDDLMEPFRPAIDWQVWKMLQQGIYEINTDTKRALVKCLYMDLVSDNGMTPMVVAIQKLTTSLAQVMLKERAKLDFPLPGIPMESITVDSK